MSEPIAAKAEITIEWGVASKVYASLSTDCDAISQELLTSYFVSISGAISHHMQVLSLVCVTDESLLRATQSLASTSHQLSFPLCFLGEFNFVVELDVSFGDEVLPLDNLKAAFASWIEPVVRSLSCEAIKDRTGLPASVEAMLELQSMIQKRVGIVVDVGMN